MAGNIVPRADGHANLGRADKEFDTIYAKNLGGTLADKVAMKDSPAFIGTPTAPTAAEGTQTTQVATTEFVQTANAGKVDKTELTEMEQLIKQYIADELAKYLPLSGGALTGSTIKRAVDSSFLDLYGGTGWTSGGAAISLNGKDRAGATAGAFGVRVNNGTASKEMWLKPDGTFTLDNKEIKTMAFPSKTIISVPLTFSAGSAAYTAPANGYFMAMAKSTAATYAILETNTTSGVRHRQNVTATGEYMSNTIPVKKGDSITVIIAGSATFQYANFIYAEGEV